MIRRLARCIRDYKAPTIWTPVLIIGEAILESLIPFIIAELVNQINDGCPFETIVRYGLILFGMACLSLCFGGLAGYTAARAAGGFAKNLRHDMYACIQQYSFGNIDRFSASSLVTRMTTDVLYVQMSFMQIIRTAVRCPLMFIFSIVMAYVMGGALATMFVVVVPILLFGLLMIARKAMPAFHRVFRKYDRLNEAVEENVRAMRTVKGFAREEYEKEKFAAASDDIRRDFTRAERIVALNSPLMQFCIYFNMVAVLFFGSRLIISSTGAAINVGQLSSMLTYGFQILMSLMMLSMVYVILTISAESAHRILEVLEEVPALRDPENPVETVQDGSVDFDGVCFKYAPDAEKDTLADIRLHIASGQTVGILGGTGSSKSTLVQLIPRLYDVTAGTVSVGGIDVRRYSLQALRDQVSMVLQNNQLFSGTIRDNLRWGNPDATDEQMEQACRIACADDFVRAFPQGYDTMISQGGTNVSGGQKQRLCIARALLKKPKILIFDDSTSAVDTKTDAHIRAQLAQALPQTTKIIIAQRIASVQQADLIVIMDGGRITATGTHDQLLQTCQIYQDLWAQQTGGATA
ncbi:MAG: ABC transporter ATP-binding protein [Clostridia bacterium]|nr:ABC transporter ATP-binding protein [Clostridia bacterium]